MFPQIDICALSRLVNFFTGKPFFAESKQSFSLLSFYPKRMIHMSEKEYMNRLENVKTLYHAWASEGFFQGGENNGFFQR